MSSNALADRPPPPAVATPVLQVSNLSKTYCTELRRSLRYGATDMVRAALGRPARPMNARPGEFLALDDVSFSVARGQALAVLGRNGAGKSTLIKVLNGLLKPNAGEVRIAGRVGALIELGTGFDPSLTGRENIRVTIAIHGFPAAGESELIAEVIDFSGLGAVIDTPFQTYSSGMKARLAFSVVAMMRPDLLMIDEVLAVGDHVFQRKCISFLLGYLKQGGALLFVSHNSHQIQAICERAVLLERGRLVYTGAAAEALNEMYERNPPLAAVTGGIAQAGPLAITGLSVSGPEGAPPRTGAPLHLALRYRAEAPVAATWGLTVWSADGWVCVTSAVDERARQLAAGEGVLTCVIPRLPLAPGRYQLGAAIVEPDTLQPIVHLGEKEGRMILDVTAAPGPMGNLQRQRGQLVEIDVDWR